MQIKTNIQKIGASHYMRLPPSFLEYLGITSESEMIIQDEKGKKGKFFSAWKNED